MLLTVFTGIPRQFAPAELSPTLINAAIRRNAPQPIYEVRRRLDRSQSLIELQKNLLGQVFRQRRVLQEMVGDTENHALVLPHKLGKSQGIALG